MIAAAIGTQKRRIGHGVIVELFLETAVTSTFDAEHAETQSAQRTFSIHPPGNPSRVAGNVLASNVVFRIVRTWRHATNA